ncbi:hypothetical protein GCM10020331_075770 [Ectobacillus funiculus]
MKFRSMSENIAGYAFISPFIIGFLAFTIIPMAISLYLSFTNYDLFSTPKWIGLDNYIEMFTGDEKVLAFFTGYLHLCISRCSAAIGFRIMCGNASQSCF